MSRKERHWLNPPAPRPNPSITIIHSCTNPASGWHEAFRQFTSLASSPLSIEYILIIDHARRKDLGILSSIFRQHDGSIDTSESVGSFNLALNRGQDSDGYIGLKHASPDTIKLFITDDSRPSSVSWDRALLSATSKELTNA